LQSAWGRLENPCTKLGTDIAGSVEAVGRNAKQLEPASLFALATVNLVLGAVTCAGKLSLVVEYVQENVNAPTMEKIKDHALQFLLVE
jgi:hypothetical protein